MMRKTLLILAALSAVTAVFLYTRIQERNHLLDRFIAEALQGVPREDTDAVVMALSRAVFARTHRAVPKASLDLFDRLEATSVFNVSTGASLKYGIYGVNDNGPYGPCGTMSRVLLNALWRLHVPARKLQLLPTPGTKEVQHTMVEYRVGDRWHVISPSDSSFVWHNAEGQVATACEIRTDPAIFQQVKKWRSWWSASFRHPSNIRWDKLPAPVRNFLRQMLGPERYAAARTPRLYDQPRTLLFMGSLASGALLGLLGLLVAGHHHGHGHPHGHGHGRPSLS